MKLRTHLMDRVGNEVGIVELDSSARVVNLAAVGQPTRTFRYSDYWMGLPTAEDEHNVFFYETTPITITPADLI